MQRLGLVMLIVLVATGVGYAGSCPATTYDNYLGLGSCTGDGDTFSSFAYSASGSNPLAASAIAVNPITTVGNPGFLFNAPWSVTSSQTQDSLIGFLVTSNVPNITDLTLQMFGAGFSGTALVSVAETYCLGDTFSDGCSKGTQGTLFVYLGSGGSKLSDSVNFAGVTEVDVKKDIELVGGASGFGVLSGVMNQFSDIPVPEPAELSLLGGGLTLLGVGLLRRKRSV
jgi:hypothetical protein